MCQLLLAGGAFSGIDDMVPTASDDARLRFQQFFKVRFATIIMQSQKIWLYRCGLYLPRVDLATYLCGIHRQWYPSEQECMQHYVRARSSSAP